MHGLWMNWLVAAELERTHTMAYGLTSIIEEFYPLTKSLRGKSPVVNGHLYSAHSPTYSNTYLLKYCHKVCIPLSVTWGGQLSLQTFWRRLATIKKIYHLIKNVLLKALKQKVNYIMKKRTAAGELLLYCLDVWVTGYE